MARDFDVDRQGDESEPGSGELTVFFSDEAAHDHEDLVARSVAVIAGFPGVADAYHEDRELIVVSGPALDPQVIESLLETWWNSQLGRT